jgi:Aconitase A
MKLHETGAYLLDRRTFVLDSPDACAQVQQQTGQAVDPLQARKGTMAYAILQAHNTSGNAENLKIRFDAMASHDITYVGIIQTARASGMTGFPLPYVLTNCHNSLSAVGGTINEDDHMFAISAAKKYGGIYVPPHLAVIHQYMREMMAGCGKMILGSDSHTRYGALGTMAIGEGGGELAKQLLGRTYDLSCPPVVAVHLKNAPRPGVGPQDVALALIGAVFASGYVKNKVLEFVGEGIANLPVEYRGGIDVMTTETTCLSSIWETDGQVEEYLRAHGRADEYKKLAPERIAYYDGLIEIDLAEIEPMIALPFHPSNTFSIRELRQNAKEIFYQVELDAKRQYGKHLQFELQSKVRPDGIYVDQGVIAGCAGGTFANICAAVDVMQDKTPGNDRFSLSAYPSSQPTYIGLVKNGVIGRLMEKGIIVRSAFCGPCFGAGDVPANGALSVRHVTRNFPNREGSRPGDGQLSSVALMDARSIAATAANGGRLTAATELDIDYAEHPYTFSDTVYKNRLYQGYGQAKPQTELQFGPNITNWPQMSALTDHLLLQVAALIADPVTTTDELIPSGETSSYRSNPLRLAEFTLSRKDPEYVDRAKAVQKGEAARLQGGDVAAAAVPGLAGAMEQAAKLAVFQPGEVGIGSLIYAKKPGDGSAREQAASCQKVLGGWANIAQEYATKRYRSNLINWGVLPFLLDSDPPFACGDYLFIPNVREAIESKTAKVDAYLLGDRPAKMALALGDLTDDERKILLDGCLINFYKSGN